jgi:uncharacterized OB-fold protein
LNPGPREICAACLSHKLETIDLPGAGKLVAWTIIRRAPTRFRGDAPYAVCVVELDVGNLRVTGRLANPAVNPLPGSRLRAIDRREGYSIFMSEGA